MRIVEKNKSDRTTCFATKVSVSDFALPPNEKDDSYPATTMSEIGTETRWIDAWIRWERDSKHMVTHDDDEDQDGHTDDSDDEPMVPTDTFSFRYKGSANQPAIDIDLKGFPSDSEQTWNSTGLTLWRSSEYLCDYLFQEWRTQDTSSPNMFDANNRFLELGSGLGRCGILALHCLSLTNAGIHASQRSDKLLCLTDGDTDVLHQLRDNLERNKPKYIQRNSNISFACSQLLWQRERAIQYLEKIGGKPFDVIFGSDLIYVSKVIEPLFETVTALLDKSGRFIMAHCARRHGNEVSVDMVLETADSFGLHYQVVERDDDISVFVFRWKG